MTVVDYVFVIYHRLGLDLFNLETGVAFKMGRHIPCQGSEDSHKPQVQHSTRCLVQECLTFLINNAINLDY